MPVQAELGPGLGLRVREGLHAEERAGAEHPEA